VNLHEAVPGNHEIIFFHDFWSLVMKLITKTRDLRSQVMKYRY
jgi:hypothetical protein